MKPATLYVDFVSPYAYLAMKLLDEVAGRLDIEIRPVLFAGLLNHWENKGPAEIPPKRIHTFRTVRWYADKNGIEYKMPPHHPFNPLRALRLAIALGSTRDVVDAIFDQIWRHGNLPDDAGGWAAIQSALQVTDGDSLTADPVVKDQLRANGEAAVADDVFGVPTFVVDGEGFWGVDSMDMLIDWLDGRLDLADAEAQRILTIKPSAERPGSKG